MASITKRPNKEGSMSFRVEIRLKGYPPQRATFARLTDARLWAKETETDIRRGRHFKTAEARRHTVGDMLDRYIRDVLPTKQPSTQRAQRFQFAWWKAELGHLTLADVTPAVVAEARDRLLNTPSKRGGRLSPAYVVRHLSALSHAFSVAVREWEWSESNPVSKVRKPTEPRGRVRFLSDQERGALLSACKESSNPSLYVAVVMALATGMRKGELMALRWQDVDLQARRITLHHTKNGERRVVPLAGPALALLQEHAKVPRLDTNLIFPGSKRPPDPDGKAREIIPMDLRAPWETALKRAGIEDFRWHDLRHCSASYLAMSGASLTEIADVLGHKTLAMVKRYTHLSESHTAGIVERMNARIFAET
jgi:integrase